jgi:uncharacterized membrane protein YcfT
MNLHSHAGRVAWVDYAKGFCIIMVVMMHSTLGVEKAAGGEGWMHALVAFATPFRMPDFFLISGLFLSRVIDREWRDYLDRKVVHFGYFYLLWLTIQFAFKAPEFASDVGVAGVFQLYLLSLIDPFGTIWFIYLLPIFFVVVKATRRVPWWIVWPIGAALEMAHVHSGWIVIDEFAARFVYFYSGYMFAPLIFRFADAVRDHPVWAAAYLGGWAMVNGIAVFGGVAPLPGLSLALGLVGAAAVVAFATLLSRSGVMAAVRYIGRNSIVIYLAFFLPMAASRIVLLRLGIIEDIGTISLIVTAAGVVFPLVLFWLVRGTPFRFLFQRPEFTRLAPSRARLQPAE